MCIMDETNKINTNSRICIKKKKNSIHYIVYFYFDVYLILYLFKSSNVHSQTTGNTCLFSVMELYLHFNLYHKGPRFIHSKLYVLTLYFKNI